MPARSVPRKFPAMTLFDEPAMRMARLGQPLITSPRIVLPELPTLRSSAPVPHAPALSSMIGRPAGRKPGCVVPLMMTGRVMGSSAAVRVIVCTPPAPMTKSMVSMPTVAFASRMASRRVHTRGRPGSESHVPSAIRSGSSASPVLLTVNVAAWAGPATKTERSTSEPRQARIGIAPGPNRDRFSTTGLIANRPCRATGGRPRRSRRRGFPVSSDPHRRVSEEVVDGEELGEGSRLGVGLLRGEDRIA